MLYYSQLLVDTGSEFDTFRPGRLWLDNTYHIYETLQHAFHTKITQYTSEDAVSSSGDVILCDFPDDCDNTVWDGWDIPDSVENEEQDRHPFLFRIERENAGAATVVVTSTSKPDWDAAFEGLDDILTTPPQGPQLLQSDYVDGTVLRFRVLGHPLFSEADSKHEHRTSVLSLSNIYNKPSPYISPNEESAFRWLEIKGFKHGFRIQELPFITHGLVYANKTTHSEHGRTLQAVQFEGHLRVMDRAKFKEALQRGIGPGKMYGFGLLSVAFLGCRFEPQSNGY